METIQIRQKLHQYIESSDEKLLKMMLALAKEYHEDEDEDDFEYNFSDEEIRIFDERRQKRINGESTIQTWQQAKEIIFRKHN